jgi:hypothetical protein
MFSSESGQCFFSAGLALRANPAWFRDEVNATAARVRGLATNRSVRSQTSRTSLSHGSARFRRGASLGRPSSPRVRRTVPIV